MSYYTSITVLCWLALAVLSVLVWENGRLSRMDKRYLYITYAVLALAALAEWLGVTLSGRETTPAWLLLAVKCADYILTPGVGGALAMQLRSRSVWRKLLIAVLAVNTVLQLVCAFTGWMVRIDAQHRYIHGPLYGAYAGVYFLIIALVIIEFAVYGKRFRRQNRWSLYAVLFLVIVGILMQELPGEDVRTSYMALTLGMSLMFIHYSEYSQLAADDVLQEQMILISTDVLTGLYSRHVYAKSLKDLGASPPKGLVVFSIDVNGLKTVNDTLGHEAGDELICGAARCITATFGNWGICCRTGGDEFVVLAEMDPRQAKKVLAQLNREAAAWHGEKVKELSLAAGFAAAADHPELSAEKLVSVADQAMYAEKAAFYRSAGRDRRRR